MQVNTIMVSTDKYVNSLRKWAQFSLFTTSYAPLFALIILKQFHNNIDFFYWGGFDLESILCLVEKFGLSTLLFLIGSYGLYGANKTLKNVEKRAINGFPVIISEVKNKSSESINYIATYIIPFAFQTFDTWFDLVSILVILIIIYSIFINSTLLLINPLLSFKYGLYEIEFLEDKKTKTGMVITKDKFLVENENVKLYAIGHKMYYAIKN